MNHRCHEPRHAYSAEFRAKLQRTRTERSKVPRATKNPTTRDLEWAAGFLEGEGNFRGVSKGEMTARVRCSQVNPEPIYRLAELFGGSIGHVFERGPRRQPFYQWQLSGARARGVMMTLWPLMSQVRRDQIAGALPGRPLRGP